MSEERRILDMLSEGTIDAGEAERLLALLRQSPDEETAVMPVEGGPPTKQKVRYLRVLIDAQNREGKQPAHVDIRVPLQLLRAGVKLGALIPQDDQEEVSEALQEKGIEFDLSSMSPEAVDELIEGLSELTVDVDAGDEESGKVKVRIFCEA